jgi:dihydrofolate reductase
LSVRVSIIAAVADNGVIGRGNALPWSIKSEMAYFKKTTMGKPVVLGRKSFESIGKPLPGRDNIVVTRSADFSASGVRVMHDLDSALAHARALALGSGLDEIFVLGGAEIYRQALPAADRLYITEIHATPEGDTLFPAIDRSQWVEIQREHHDYRPEETAAYSLTILERKLPKS